MAAAARERAQRRRMGATGLGEGKGEREAAGRAVRRREGGFRNSRGGARSARSGWGGSGRGAPTSCLSRPYPGAGGLAGQPGEPCLGSFSAGGGCGLGRPSRSAVGTRAAVLLSVEENGAWTWSCEGLQGGVSSRL